MKIDMKKLEDDIYHYRKTHQRIGRDMTEGEFCRVVNISKNTLNYVRKKEWASRITVFKLNKVLGENTIVEI